MSRNSLAVCFVTWGIAIVAIADETYFAFDSSPASWVGQGYTNYFVSPETGWSFAASRNYDNGVAFNISRDAGPDPGLDNYYWGLDLAAPFEATLTPGLYTDAARFPFQDADQPGLTLHGNHRGNNRNGGFFEVLEAVYGPGGEVLRFSVDFTQYDEERPDWWIVGQLRYKATIIPEPESLILICSLMSSGAIWYMRRLRWR